MTFDWTISIGNLLTIIGFAGSGVVFVMFIRADLQVLSSRVMSLEGTTRELVQANLIMSELRGRSQTLETRVDHISERLDKVIDLEMRAAGKV